MARRLRAQLMEPLRKRGRVVAWTPEFMGFGNVLFLVLWAEQGSCTGSPRWVLETPALTPWLSVFPSLRERVLTREQVRITDQRTMPWRQEAKSVDFGGAHIRGFTDAEMTAFVKRFLVSGLKPDAAPRLVVNVRRGDYYSVPEIRGQFGFDVEGYLRVAVRRSIRDDGPTAGIHVVTDGADWCREHLGWLADLAPVLTYASPDDGPIENFRAVAQARRLVITNSTFSYWAAFVSTALHGSNHAQVVAPRFFDRSQNGGRGWLLDERWSIVEGIPGGWDL